MTAWERYWYGPIAAIRPYLLMRAVYAVLALDLWIVTMQRGGRYGFGGFNVAHFAWLDAVQPQPGPALYVGLLLTIGLLALICALCDPSRWVRALVALLHTYSWAMSLHDVFQHHYFLSLVLTAFVFFPRAAAADLIAPRAAARPTVSAWAYALLGANLGIMYAFAGLSKLDVAWRTGEVLRIAPLSRLGAIQSWAEGLAVPPDLFWSIVALGVVATEWTVAAGYLVAVRRDATRSRLVAGLAWLALVLAVGFHASAETVLSIRIGWFTYYVIATACVYLLPSGILHAMARPALRGAAWLDALWRRLSSPAVEAAVVAGVALFVGGIGFALDLPGAEVAGIAVAAVIVAAAAGPRLLGRGDARPIACAVAGVLAAAMLWSAVAASDARFEYYMAVARQLERTGARDAAADTYERARRYGESPVAGVWSSGGSVLRVAVRRGEATASFVAVGDNARRLGFKPGDVSFVARVSGRHLTGRMTLRYANACHPEGRAVPMIGFVRRDGEALITHFFNFTLGAACEDVGAPAISDEVWNLVVGAR